MDVRRSLVVILFCTIFSFECYATPQENGINAIKTADGFVLVWNRPDIHFTLAVKGKDVRPLNSTEHVFFNVDGIVFQVQSVAVSEFVKDAQKKKLNDMSILLAHRDWESQFIESTLLGKKLNVQTVSQKLSNVGEALLWKFEMPALPEVENVSAKEQIYLTVVSGDHVILLNSVAEGAISASTAQKFLLDTISTLRSAPSRSTCKICRNHPQRKCPINGRANEYQTFAIPGGFNSRARAGVSPNWK